MTKPKDGRRVFPVVACPAAEPSSLCPCELTFRYHRGRKQASIALRVAVAVDGADDMHTFAAQYDADNLSTTAFGAATGSLPQASRDRIARDADPEMMTLFLCLQNPCTLWCPALETIAPKPGFEESFSRLAQLARATAVHITLDYGWLHKDLRAPFEQLVQGQARLFTTGYPLGDYYRQQGLRPADWTVVSPVDAAAAAAAPPAPPAPPAYHDAVTKRPNQDSTLSSPPRKRVLREAPPSPTECASSPVADKVRTATECEETDFQFQAISHVVKRHLPDALEALLPALLPTLFVTSDPALSSSGPQTSQPPKLTPLGQSFLTQLIAQLQPQIQPQLQGLYQDALEESGQLRDHAELEFSEIVEDYKLDVAQLKEDTVDDVQRLLTSAVEDARCEARDLAEHLSDESYQAVIDKLDMLETVRLRRLLTWEKCPCGSTQRTPDWRRVKWARGSWARRAGKGGYRGVGRRWSVLSLS